jgi:hypothetical protein
MTTYFDLQARNALPEFMPSPVETWPTVRPSFESDKGREKLEQYIAGVFYACWDAQILEYLPLLFSLERETGYSAALGVRAAGKSHLFCETYLDTPVEQQVKRVHGYDCPRSGIMELGNLAASSAGDGALLYLLVTHALHAAEIRFLLFTANRAVRHSIRRTGFTPVALGSADPNRLQDEGSRWGRYYEGDPQVMLGDISLSWEQSQAEPALRKTLEQHAPLVEELAETIREYNW